MSPKELLYIQDALGHAQHMEKKCRQCATQILQSSMGGYPAPKADGTHNPPVSASASGHRHTCP